MQTVGEALLALGSASLPELKAYFGLHPGKSEALGASSSPVPRVRALTRVCVGPAHCARCARTGWGVAAWSRRQRGRRRVRCGWWHTSRHMPQPA
ncbi:hypothetical protein EON67_09905, partial [archaeon]